MFANALAWAARRCPRARLVALVVRGVRGLRTHGGGVVVGVCGVGGSASAALPTAASPPPVAGSDGAGRASCGSG